MSDGRLTAIGHRINEGFRVIAGSMRSDSEPQVPSAPQSETREHAETEAGKRSHPSLAAISEMDRAKCRGKQHGRRPEADSRAERVLRVASKEELLEDADQHKADGPEQA